MMYFCVFITLLNLFIIYFYYKRNSNRITIGSYILLLYAFSVFLTLLIHDETIIFSIGATLYFNIILFFFLIPIMRFKGYKIQTLGSSKLKIFDIISYFFIISGLGAIIYFIPTVYKLFSSDISLLFLRTNMVGGERYVNTATLLYDIFNLISQFYPIVLILYFYSITFLHKSKLFNFLLLLSSTSYVFNVLTAVGRDGFILWMMSYFFGYLVFRNFMDIKLQRKQIRLFYFSIGIALLFLVPITVDRFFYQGFEAGYDSILQYSGAQFSNFNNFFNRIPNPEEYGSFTDLFPIFDLDRNDSSSFLDSWEDRVWAFGIDPNVFSTFIGSFYLNIGKIGTFILGLIFFVIGNLISKNSSQVSLSKIILITLFAQVILHGFFYYKLAYTVSNIYMILTVLISLFFSKSRAL